MSFASFLVSWREARGVRDKRVVRAPTGGVTGEARSQDRVSMLRLAKRVRRTKRAAKAAPALGCQGSHTATAPFTKEDR